MTGSNEACAVCGEQSFTDGGLSRLFIEGCSLVLCRVHAGVVASAMPRTMDETRALFVGFGSTREGERRSPIRRRDPEDRRVFPPRPEGRRMSNGRRSSDPRL